MLQCPSLYVFSNLGWLYYGVLKKDGTVMLVNSIGASLQCLYILTYFHYAKEKVGEINSGAKMIVNLLQQIPGMFAAVNN